MQGLMTRNESWFFSKGELLAMHVMGEQLPNYAILDSTVTQNSLLVLDPLYKSIL